MKNHLTLFMCFILFSCSGSDAADDHLVGSSQQEDGANIPEFEVLEDTYIEDAGFKVVGYFPNYRYDVLDQIDFKKITHLNFIKAYPTMAGKLAYDNENEIDEAIQLAKQKNPNLKIMMTLGGGSLTSVQKEAWIKFLKKENRTTFVQAIVEYVKEHDLYGIDVDLEGNILPDIASDYGPFIKHLKNDLHGIGKAITAAMPATHSHSIDVETLKEFDFINIMCYGRGNKQSYSFAEDAIDYWTQSMGISKEKLVLGVPFFGWTSEVTPSAYLYKNAVLEDINNAFNDKLGINNHNSITTIVKKTLLAKEKLNGIMIWELGQDSFDDLSLLSAIDQTIKVNCSGEVNTYFKDSDGDGLGDITKPLQACEAPSSYVNNNEDCDDDNPEIGDCN